MPNVMVALPNIGGSLCSTPQSLADALTRCRTVTLPRRETRWNLQGCPKLANRSQPLVGWSSPYYEDISLLNKFFFRLSIRALVAKIEPDKVVQWCADGDFLGPAFPASRAQHISDLHYKFTLGLHYVTKYDRHSIYGRWD